MVKSSVVLGLEIEMLVSCPYAAGLAFQTLMEWAADILLTVQVDGGHRSCLLEQPCSGMGTQSRRDSEID